MADEPHDAGTAFARLFELMRRHQLVVLGAAALFMVALLLLAVVRDLAGSAQWAYDFDAYYDALQRLIATGSPYQAQTLAGPFAAGPFGLYLYSPAPVVLMLPLGGLSVANATAVFVALKLAMLVVTCALMPVSRSARLATLALACLSAPVLEDIDLGNASLLVTFLAVLGWRWLDRPAGSAALAGALAIRPTLTLFAGWWMVRAQWRALAWLAATVLAMILVTLPFVGLQGWLDYLTVLRNLTGFNDIPRNLALGPVVQRLVVEPLGGPDWLAGAGQLGGYAVALLAVAASLRRDRELSFVVTLGATTLLSPLMWDHYLTMVLVPAAFLANRGRWWGLWLVMLCWLPQDLLVIVAYAAMLLPFAAPASGERVRSLFDRLPSWRQPLPA